MNPRRISQLERSEYHLGPEIESIWTKKYQLQSEMLGLSKQGTKINDETHTFIGVSSVDIWDAFYTEAPASIVERVLTSV